MNISRAQKIFLMAMGVLWCLGCVEIGLRIGGYLIKRDQQRANKQVMRQGGIYRVLCVGESTTRGQYTRYLAQALARCSGGERYTVIDEGIGGANSSTIVQNLPAWMEEYGPDVLVVMMGINDRTAYSSVSQPTGFFSSWKLYKLTRLIWSRFAGIGLKPEVSKHAQTRARVDPTEPFRRDLDEKIDKIVYDGLLFRPLDETERELKKIISEHPEDGAPYVGLAIVYTAHGRPSQTEYAVKSALKTGIKNPYAALKAARGLLSIGRAAEAERLVTRTLERTPSVRDSAWLLRALGEARLQQKKLALSAKALQKAFELDPESVDTCLQLGELYWTQKRTGEAERIMLEGYGRYPDSDKIAGMLGAFYLDTGRPVLAREYFRKSEESRDFGCKQITRRNYLKLISIARSKDVHVVCMQYPMRSAAPLRAMVESFYESNEVTVVDNEKTFKDAVEKEGYNAIFTDRFSGDFGHCSEKGNRLIAENLAKHIHGVLSE